MGYDVSDFNSDVQQQIKAKMRGIRVTREPQTLVIGEIAPGLNGKDGLLREHWKKRGDRVQKYANWIAARRPAKAASPVRIIYTRYSVHRMDPDNAAASFKCWGDALVQAGVLDDDSPDIIQDFTVRSRRCSEYRKQRTEITIEPLTNQ